MSTGDWINFFVVLTVLADVAIVALVAVVVAGRFGRPSVVESVRVSLGDQGLRLGALVTGVATAGSLYLSKGAHLVPCEFCWYQRIAMYPLALVLVIAAIRRDWGIRPYALTLAGIGLALSTYHYLIQRFPDLEASTSCDPLNPCTATLVWKLHFISIPFMAGSAFTLTLLVLVLARPPARTRSEVA
jgi:disulfide bond formation protein DsbB